MQPKRIRWMAWWYFAIAIGFALLAIDHILLGDRLWLIAVRVVIAAGFGLLATWSFTVIGATGEAFKASGASGAYHLLVWKSRFSILA